MKVELHRRGDMAVLKADGSPEELASFCRLVGLDIEGRGVAVEIAKDCTCSEGTVCRQNGNCPRREA